MRVLGLDIGGANIKASDADGQTIALNFPLWTDSHRLHDVLTDLRESFPSGDMVALTMTGELADCFAAKSEGVEFIIDAVERVFANTPVRVWMTSGEFAEPADARELPMLVAAANWQALATWVGRAVPAGPAILLDMGSTTTDIIPLLDGRPIPTGLNDTERLLSGELVYSGAFRTPVCAMVSAARVHDRECPVAAELFATIADALVVSGRLPEAPEIEDTADGRPLTAACCQQRLARMLCADATELPEDDILQFAHRIADAQLTQLRTSLTAVVTRLEDVVQQEEPCSTNNTRPTLLLSGSGAAIARRLFGDSQQTDSQSTGTLLFENILELPTMFTADIAESACAFAVARLAQERCRDDLLAVSDFPITHP